MTNRWIKTYKSRLIVPLYMVFYLIMFFCLEDRCTYRIHIIRSSADYSIPFCEYFIIPYIVWFFFIALTVLWFMFKNKNEKEYLQLIISLMFGMTIFLFTSWLFPNGHYLRPRLFPRDNIFTDMVRMLYKIDTSTNILPSIHVYNSVAVCLAVMRCRYLQKYTFVRIGTCGLTILIVLSTLFLKQHSIIDVVLAFALNFIVYLIVYYVDDHRVFSKQRAAVRSGII